MIEQLNIFGEIDFISEDGTRNACEVCGKSMKEEADCCSIKCAEIAIERIFGSLQEKS